MVKMLKLDTVKVALLFAVLGMAPCEDATAASEPAPKSEEQLEQVANEDCRARHLQPGHSFVHWHAVANVTSYYYRCNLDKAVKVECANGKRADGARDVVCEVLHDGTVDPYDFKGKCRCTCSKT